MEGERRSMEIKGTMRGSHLRQNAGPRWLLPRLFPPLRRESSTTLRHNFIHTGTAYSSHTTLNGFAIQLPSCYS